MIKSDIFDRTSPIPLYYQLVEYLKSEIEVGKYTPDEKFPTERQLISEYKLSSQTVRNALRELVSLGFLVREQGRGTFVKPQVGWKTEDKKAIKYSRIGLVMPWDENSLFFPMLHGIEDTVSGEGFQTLLANNQEDPNIEISKMREMAAHGIDGLIWMCPVIGSNKALVKKIIQEIPVVVTVDRNINLEGIELNSVSSDNFNGMKQMVNTLLDKGYSRIALVHEPNTVSSTMERIAGFKAAFEEQNISLPEEWKFTSRKTYMENGQICADKIVKSKTDFNAICCLTDHTAVGVIRELKTRNIKVPDDMAVTGFNDSQVAITSDPTLTTVRQDIRLMGQQAAELVLHQLNTLEHEKEIKPKHIAVPVELIVRESS